MTRGDRPEVAAPPEIFYNEEEARKYTTNSRMISIQAQLTERALELLALPDDGRSRMLLDLGCGSGLSGEALSEAGHVWVGTDISAAMLDVALDREVEGDLCLHDLGAGLPLRAGTFDGAISISAVQWLCNADWTGADPRKRMRRFFESLYACLVSGGRAVLQIYPQDAHQAQALTASAMRAGFAGGLVVDYPHSTRAKKYFLVLMVGGNAGGGVPAARGLDGGEEGGDDEDGAIAVAGRHQQGKKQRRGMGGAGFSARHPDAKGKAWILKKKEQARHKGYVGIPADTRYTGRKRKDRF